MNQKRKISLTSYTSTQIKNYYSTLREQINLAYEFAEHRPKDCNVHIKATLWMLSLLNQLKIATAFTQEFHSLGDIKIKAILEILEKKAKIGGWPQINQIISTIRNVFGPLQPTTSGQATINHLYVQSLSFFLLEQRFAALGVFIDCLRIINMHFRETLQLSVFYNPQLINLLKDSLKALYDSRCIKILNVFSYLLLRDKDYLKVFLDQQMLTNITKYLENTAITKAEGMKIMDFMFQLAKASKNQPLPISSNFVPLLARFTLKFDYQEVVNLAKKLVVLFIEQKIFAYKLNQLNSQLQVLELRIIFLSLYDEELEKSIASQDSMFSQWPEGQFLQTLRQQLLILSYCYRFGKFVYPIFQPVLDKLALAFQRQEDLLRENNKSMLIRYTSSLCGMLYQSELYNQLRNAIKIIYPQLSKYSDCTSFAFECQLYNLRQLLKMKPVKQIAVSNSAFPNQSKEKGEMAGMQKAEECYVCNHRDCNCEKKQKSQNLVEENGKTVDQEQENMKMVLMLEKKLSGPYHQVSQQHFALLQLLYQLQQFFKTKGKSHRLPQKVIETLRRYLEPSGGSFMLETDLLQEQINYLTIQIFRVQKQSDLKGIDQVAQGKNYGTVINYIHQLLPVLERTPQNLQVAKKVISMNQSQFYSQDEQKLKKIKQWIQIHNLEKDKKITYGQQEHTKFIKQQKNQKIDAKEEKLSLGQKDIIAQLKADLSNQNLYPLLPACEEYKKEYCQLFVMASKMPHERLRLLIVDRMNLLTFSEMNQHADFLQFLLDLKQGRQWLLKKVNTLSDKQYECVCEFFFQFHQKVEPKQLSGRQQLVRILAATTHFQKHGQIMEKHSIPKIIVEIFGAFPVTQKGTLLTLVANSLIYRKNQLRYKGLVAHIVELLADTNPQPAAQALTMILFENQQNRQQVLNCLLPKQLAAAVETQCMLCLCVQLLREPRDNLWEQTTSKCLSAPLLQVILKLAVSWNGRKQIMSPQQVALELVMLLSHLFMSNIKLPIDLLRFSINQKTVLQILSNSLKLESICIVTHTSKSYGYEAIVTELILLLWNAFHPPLYNLKNWDQLKGKANKTKRNVEDVEELEQIIVSHPISYSLNQCVYLINIIINHQKSFLLDYPASFITPLLQSCSSNPVSDQALSQYMLTLYLCIWGNNFVNDVLVLKKTNANIKQIQESLLLQQFSCIMNAHQQGKEKGKHKKEKKRQQSIQINMILSDAPEEEGKALSETILEINLEIIRLMRQYGRPELSASSGLVSLTIQSMLYTHIKQTQMQVLFDHIDYFNKNMEFNSLISTQLLENLMQIMIVEFHNVNALRAFQMLKKVKQKVLFSLKTAKILLTFSQLFLTQTKQLQIQRFQKQAREFLCLLAYWISKHSTVRTVFNNPQFKSILRGWRKIQFSIQKEVSIVMQSARICMLALLEEAQSHHVEDQLDLKEKIRQDFECWLYRKNGSRKAAIIKVQNNEVLAFKAKGNNQIKQKYRIPLKSIIIVVRDFQKREDKYQESVYPLEDSFFKKLPNKSLCLTISAIIGQQLSCREISVQFLTKTSKDIFVAVLMQALRLQEQAIS